MADDKEEKSPVKGIAWVASLLAITGIILFVIALATQEKIPSNQKNDTTRSVYQTKKIPPRRMSGTFIVPAGNGENIEENSFSTGLFGRKNDRILYTIKNGGPIRIRTGLGKNDWIETSSNHMTKSNGFGEIQFIKYKSVRIHIRIIPS